MMFRILLIVFIISNLSFAKSNYVGTYLCNDRQEVIITLDNLSIGNTSFTYKETRDSKRFLSDLYIYKSAVAIFTNFASKDSEFRIFIADKKNLNTPYLKNAYIGNCIKY